MFVRIFTLICFAIAATPAHALAQTRERSIDTTASKAGFSIAHVFVEHVLGTVPIEGGTASFSGDSPIPSSVSVTLDATRVSTGDRDQTACIQGTDYFDVKQFPTWTFASTKITPHGSSAFGIDGMLTMHGVTQPEHFDVIIESAGGRTTYHAVGHIDRHVFGMKGSRLDPAIGGVADVTLDVVLR